ncbi:hypothetical protein ACOSP7_029391 [Xanthoceras sorbifolium]
MARLFILCLILFLADAFLGLAMATQTTQQPILHTKAAPTSNPPAPSPSIRKLGKYQQNIFKSFHESALSPSEAPQAARETTVSSHETAVSNQSSNDENVRVQGSLEEIHLKRNHHSVDKSVAGGGVILGGLATTFLVTIFCYIRATRRHQTNNRTQTTV